MHLRFPGPGLLRSDLRGAGEWMPAFPRLETQPEYAVTVMALTTTRPHDHVQPQAVPCGPFLQHGMCQAGSQFPAELPPSSLHLIHAAPLCLEHGNCHMEVPTCPFGRSGADVIGQHSPTAHVVAFHVGHQEVMPFPGRRMAKTSEAASQPQQDPSLPQAAASLQSAQGNCS